MCEDNYLSKINILLISNSNHASFNTYYTVNKVALRLNAFKMHFDRPNVKEKLRKVCVIGNMEL